MVWDRNFIRTCSDPLRRRDWCSHMRSPIQSRKSAVPAIYPADSNLIPAPPPPPLLRLSQTILPNEYIKLHRQIPGEYCRIYRERGRRIDGDKSAISRGYFVCVYATFEASKAPGCLIGVSCWSYEILPRRSSLLVKTTQWVSIYRQLRWSVIGNIVLSPGVVT